MKNKFLAVLFSAAVAFALWMYVITVVSPESEKTYYEIPVVLQNKEVLSQRGLMIVSENPKVTLKLKGNRATLNELNENNINVIVDLANVEKDGTHNLTYTISFPGNISTGAVSVMSSSTEMITLKLENRITKEVPIVVPEDTLKLSSSEYLLRKMEMFRREDNVDIPVNFVEISGPESVVTKITQAVIDDVNLKDKTKTFSESYIYALCDEDGKAVNAEKVTTNVDVVKMAFTIKKQMKVTLSVGVIPGLGATAENTTIELDQKEIWIAGEEEQINNFPAVLEIGKIDLAKYTENADIPFDLASVKQLQGMEIVTGIDQVTAKLNLDNVKSELFKVTNIQLINVPEGMTADTIEKVITVTVRGTKELIEAMKAEDISVVVDCTGLQIGKSEVKMQFQFAEPYSSVAAVEAGSVQVEIKKAK